MGAKFGLRTAVEALYLHTPFCFHKCHYCDFYSIVEASDATPDRQSAFIDALCAEITQAAAVARLAPRTIFVGGGTPTLLPAELWQRILQTLEQLGITRRVREFTVEANPETITGGLLELLRAGGVNRVSIGAQSFDIALLKTLERWHDPLSVARAVASVRAAGIDNINLDLIFAIPGQTLAALEHDLDRALELEPAHLSCYSLIYEPNTAMTQRLKRGQIQPVAEDIERDMYALVMDKLALAGFEHYEVSNWARYVPDPADDDDVSARQGSSRRCLHNMLYWTNANWLACGPSGASHMDGHRWKNEAHLGRYIAQSPLPPTTDHERLPPQRRVGEMLMLALRLREGAWLSWIEDNIAAADDRHRAIAELVELGFLERTATHLRLTHKALFVADSVIAKLL